MDVLDAAWRAHGSPWPAVRFDSDGACARCGEVSRVTPADSVLSPKWTGWDRWRTALAPFLCPRCAWGYATTTLRQAHHHVTAEPAIQELSPTCVHRILSSPLRADECVVIVLRLGRKHVLPTAEWGRVCVDDATLPWTEADVRRLQVMAQLRGHGFGARMLLAESPAYGVLTRLPSTLHAEVMQAWRALDPWRSRRPWFEVGLRATISHGRKAAA